MIASGLSQRRWAGLCATTSLVLVICSLMIVGSEARAVGLDASAQASLLKTSLLSSQDRLPRQGSVPSAAAIVSSIPRGGRGDYYGSDPASLAAKLNTALNLFSGSSQALAAYQENRLYGFPDTPVNNCLTEINGIMVLAAAIMSFSIIVQRTTINTAVGSGLSAILIQVYRMILNNEVYSRTIGYRPKMALLDLCCCGFGAYATLTNQVYAKSVVRFICILYIAGGSCLAILPRNMMKLLFNNMGRGIGGFGGSRGYGDVSTSSNSYGSVNPGTSFGGYRGSTSVAFGFRLVGFSTVAAFAMALLLVNGTHPLNAIACVNLIYLAALITQVFITDHVFKLGMDPTPHYVVMIFLGAISSTIFYHNRK